MELSNIIQKMDSLKEELDNLRPINPDDLGRLHQKLRLDWNYNSNSIEGNTLSLSETKSFILWGITAKGKPFRDYLEMKGHNEALNKLYQIIHQDLKITESLIKDFHKLILVEPYADEKAEINPGEWKKIHNYLYSPTNERIDFAPPAEVPQRMSSLINWLNNHIDPPKLKKKKYKLHPLLIAAGFHTEFIKIHPFGDGNGRMARILTNLILMLCGYTPAIIKQEERKSYYTAINTSTLDTPENLAIFLGEVTIQSLELAIKAAKGERIEEASDLDKQLTLLDQKLKGEGTIIEKIKDEATLLEFGKTTLAEIAAKFMAVHSKFERFYVNTKFEISSYESTWKMRNEELMFDHNGNPRKISKMLAQQINSENINAPLKDKVKKSLSHLLKQDKHNIIQLKSIFRTFNRTEVESFDYQVQIVIQFNKTKFIIRTEKQEFSFFYTKQFAEGELEDILQLGAKAHLAEIEKRTALDG